MDRIIYKKNRSSVRSNSKTSSPKILNSWISQLVFIGLSAILLFSIYKAVNITSTKLDILKQAESEVEELRLTNLSLSIAMLDMSTDRYLEKEARNRLNYGGKNEIAFVLPQNSLEYAKEKVVEILKGGGSTELEPGNTIENLNVWLQFVSKGV